MAQESVIPQQLMTSALLHFERGVPIDDCDCRKEQKLRLARVSHVYWLWVKNPFLDVFQMFKQLVKGKGANRHTEWRMAQSDKLLFDFVIEHVAPPSRKVSEQKVRVTADRLMQMGAETDNGYNMEAGAKLLMKLDRLDQPESEQADMAKAAFLQPVVTVKVTDVDDTKVDYDDEQSRKIMAEFGAYIDPKRQMIEDKVAMIETKRNPVEMEEITESDEQDREQPDNEQ